MHIDIATCALLIIKLDISEWKYITEKIDKREEMNEGVSFIYNRTILYIYISGEELGVTSKNMGDYLLSLPFFPNNLYTEA
jgi:hypothetical protein